MQEAHFRKIQLCSKLTITMSRFKSRGEYRTYLDVTKFHATRSNKNGKCLDKNIHAKKQVIYRF